MGKMNFLRGAPCGPLLCRPQYTLNSQFAVRHSRERYGISESKKNLPFADESQTIFIENKFTQNNLFHDTRIEGVALITCTAVIAAIRCCRSRTIASLKIHQSRTRPCTLRRYPNGSGRHGSPLARRSADELFESAAERSFGIVADFMSDGGNFDAGICQTLGGDLHSPLSQILNRRTAHQMNKSISQCRA